MKDKKLQIFVSSTYTDLKDERQAAVEAILSSGHIPAGMELFSAGDESQMAVIERWIDESDIYLLILGGRYGSIEKNTMKSYTHLEYEYALNKNKPLFAVVMNDIALELKVKLIGSSVLEKESVKELKEFRELVLKNLVKFWDDKKDIKIAIHETISEFSYRKDLVGWIRGDNFVNTALLAEEIAKLTNENSELRNKLNKESNTLYSNLTYEELEELLRREEIIYKEDKYTAFDFFKLTCGRINQMTYFQDELKKGFDVLSKYKILKILSSNEQYGKYQLTEDGHNFYLKAILINPGIEKL